jgi:hypothetical protein
MKRIILLTLLCMMSVISSSSALGKTAYFINTTGETLSKFKIPNGPVENDILTLGSDVFCFPNQITVRYKTAYVVNSGTHEIQIIDLKTEQTTGFIDMPPGSNPYWMEFYDTRNAYITLLANNSIAKVDMQEKNVLFEVPVGSGPEGLAISRHKIFIANSAYNFSTGGYDPGTVTVYDPVTESVINTIPVDLNPQMIAVDDSSFVHVVCTGDYGTNTGRINIIDPITETVVADFAIGGYPGQIAIGPDQVAYVAAPDWSYDSHVFTYNSITHEIYHDYSNPITVGWNVNMIASFQDTISFIGCFDDIIHEIDSSGAVWTQFPSGDNPISMDFDYIPLDVNGDYTVNLGDILALISWLYVDGPPPQWPIWRADCNNDNIFNLADILDQISFLYIHQEKQPVPSPRWLRY